jgi:hypothetical protein
MFKPQSNQIIHSNRPQFDTADTRHRPKQIKKPFLRLFDGDRKVYDALVDITELQNTTTKVVYGKLQEILTMEMHITTRVMIQNLMREQITRVAINDMLNKYEDRLAAIANKPYPNESKDQYGSRTNLPIAVVNLVFDADDNDTMITE